MRHLLHIALAAACACVVPACNQPFEPDGPTHGKLAVYCILDGSGTKQYVRLSTTYAEPPSPVLHNASVWMTYDNKTVQFRDTTVMTTDASGNQVAVPVYAANAMTIASGTTYSLHVTDPSGLNVEVAAAALQKPSFSINNTKTLSRSVRQQIILNTTFGSKSGAYIMHFYLDFYAFVNGGWELHRTEVPVRSYVDNGGNTVKVYPALDLVAPFSAGRTIVPIRYDTLQYDAARAGVISKYTAAPVVWLRAVFVLSQIDDVLYNYYYVNNGPTDQATIRMDRPDYTNIPKGLGVFGSFVSTTMTYPLTN
jgi:hypothetical protein